MSKIEAVIFDWAGTTVDYGCFAPVQVFTEVFKNAGVEPTMEEVREPMGMLKWIISAPCWRCRGSRRHGERNTGEILKMRMLTKCMKVMSRPFLRYWISTLIQSPMSLRR